MNSALYRPAQAPHLGEPRSAREQGRVLDRIAEALTLAANDRARGVAALVDIARDRSSMADLVVECSPSAAALCMLREAVDCGAHDQVHLWETVLEDPLAGDLAAAAARARRTLCDARRAFVGISDATQRRSNLRMQRSRDACLPLGLEQWLDLLELRFYIERRAVRSPLQLYRLAQIARVHATRRAEELLSAPETLDVPDRH